MFRKKIEVSIIIPVRTITPYLRETISFLMNQEEKSFETIVITDKKEKLKGVKMVSSGEPTPAYKRNLGAKIAKGQILAFLDDDSYPSKDWLKRALALFSDQSLITDNRSLAAVCGPTLTPKSDNLKQKVSGLVWSSWLGSGGAGVYRNKIESRKEVQDFPSVNLLVRKKDFFSINGFDVDHWPGEDTKLCLDLIKLGKKIIYDPEVLVYHHRREIFKPHLLQISRYAMRRGYFAKNFPETSFKIGYLLPSMFVYGLIFGGILSIFNSFIRFIYLIFVLFYYFLILLSGLQIFINEKSLKLAILTTEAIFLTHLTYGFLFPFGYLNKKIKTIPHKIDIKKNVYVGG